MKKFLREVAYRKSILQTTIPTGILLGWMLSFGRYLERDGKVIFSDVSVYLLWLMESLVITGGLIFLWIGLDAYANRQIAKREIFSFKKKHWIVVFLVLTACYTISFLGVFPGFFAYDAKMAHWQVYYQQGCKYCEVCNRDMGPNLSCSRERSL